MSVTSHRMPALDWMKAGPLTEMSDVPDMRGQILYSTCMAEFAFHHQQHIRQLLPLGLRDRPVVQEGRVHIHQRDTGDAADEGDKPVEVGAAGDGDGAAEAHEPRAKGVLLPLGEHVLLAAAVAEDAALEDPHGRE
ncbi:hypothetical protein VP1G_11293 [Cytospora mali]|uniref:Uncharacterized protein n=1 Tax=Cytospora mali TaxID=578113 RepID=A0A194VBW0_CYTMA|nr:hypothetical protein VP1G_11293 [Valsa mali var. pyri (nom. inval.)]